MAHVTGLAAARHRVLADVGPRRRARRAGRRPADPRARRRGAPRDRRPRAAAARPRHRLRSSRWRSTSRGAMRADALAARAGRRRRRADDRDRPGRQRERRRDRPDARRCAPPRARPGAWVHVDGAFGLWAAASPARRHLVRGVELADSWATDAHKWLNVPFDCGIAFVRDREAHRAAIARHRRLPHAGRRRPARADGLDARVLPPRPRARRLRDAARARPRRRRRARRPPVRVRRALRRRARRRRLRGALARSSTRSVVACGDDDATDATLAAVQADGTCYPSGTTWRGRRCIRLSVCNWQTTAADVDRSIAALVAARGAFLQDRRRAPA